ncbi:hypothetical protein CA13_18750 [Planctomycetes bacterium CA13]|uniref:N-6 DNA Methylase n=1 Tax=Novipirellula herctigrandis TaxID=2527986 RepID=A0A5C5YZC8_9BACT|nr:hypothetical protein CA13_18750 [Planctomycetes bacterium CA13]
MIWIRTPATKWRNDVAMGVSPWKRNPHRAVSPEGTTGTVAHATHVAPSGLVDRVRPTIHGFAPVATTCRPFGTVLTPGRYVGAEEVEDDGVPFAEKMEGLTRELATQFHESEKRQAAIRDNMQKRGFALPEVGE